MNMQLKKWILVVQALQVAQAFEKQYVQAQFKITVSSFKNYIADYNLGKFQWFFGLHEPPTPAGLGSCGFDKGRSLVEK